MLSHTRPSCIRVLRSLTVWEHIHGHTCADLIHCTEKPDEFIYVHGHNVIAYDTVRQDARPILEDLSFKPNSITSGYVRSAYAAAFARLFISSCEIHARLRPTSAHVFQRQVAPCCRLLSQDVGRTAESRCLSQRTRSLTPISHP